MTTDNKCYNCNKDDTKDYWRVILKLGTITYIPLCNDCYLKALSRTNPFKFDFSLF